MTKFVTTYKLNDDSVITTVQTVKTYTAKRTHKLNGKNVNSRISDKIRYRASDISEDDFIRLIVDYCLQHNLKIRKRVCKLHLFPLI